MSSRKDIDFQYFEVLLEAEKKRIEKNIKILETEIDILAYEDEIGDIGDKTELEIDNKTDQKLLSNLIAELAEVNVALARIKEGTYGICEKTGRPIPIERLKISPSVRTSVSKAL